MYFYNIKFETVTTQMGLWTQSKSSLGRDPKRGFRFTVQITNLGGTDEAAGGGILWYAKTCDKPNFEISNTEHNYLNHKFNFPGRTTWSPVAIKLVDPTDPDVAATLSEIISAAGYHPPADVNDHTSMQKALATAALGDVIITQIDSDGNALERWTLWNGWISKVNYGSLDYSSDDLTELELEIVYDWATLETPSTKSNYAGTEAVGVGGDQNKFWAADGSTDPNPEDGGGPGYGTS